MAATGIGRRLQGARLTREKTTARQKGPGLARPHTASREGTRVIPQYNQLRECAYAEGEGAAGTAGTAGTQSGKGIDCSDQAETGEIRDGEQAFRGDAIPGATGERGKQGRDQAGTVPLVPIADL